MPSEYDSRRGDEEEFEYGDTSPPLEESTGVVSMRSRNSSLFSIAVIIAELFAFLLEDAFLLLLISEVLTVSELLRMLVVLELLPLLDLKWDK